jgi:hypothetical protein
MSRKLGVLLVHGMGSQNFDFADPMIEELKSLLRKHGSDPDDVEFESAWWAPVLDQKENELLRRLQDGAQLEWMSLRKFVFQSLADAIAYQGSYRRFSQDQMTVYRDVHRVIAESMARLYRRLREGKPTEALDPPLIVIAHSLGCHMMSNYIWDLQISNPKNLSPFQTFQTLSGMLTFGCNIPLFTLAFEGVKPIAFPPSGIAQFFPGASDDQVEKVTKWLTFYDPDDVLGYPLRKLSAEYETTVDQDLPVNVGSILAAWNPMSHTKYWTDNDVTRPIANLLHETLRLL